LAAVDGRLNRLRKGVLQGLKPGLILCALRGAKPPLFHDALSQPVKPCPYQDVIQRPRPV